VTRLIVLFLLLQLSCSLVWGSEDVVKLADLDASVVTPNSWQLKENFLGMHYTLFAPKSGNDRRAVIAISKIERSLGPLGSNKKDQLEQIKQNVVSSKHNWLKKRKAGLISIRTIPQGVETVYRLGAVEFLEISNYHFCSKGLIHLKLLQTAKIGATSEAAIEVVRSFKCETP
jgi:hypothetical protein